MVMKTKTELKFKKHFPFFYLHKRPLTNIEIIFDNAEKIQNLMFAAFPIIVLVKIIKLFKNH